MRLVSSATCTSGEPVSPSWVAYSLIISPILIPPTSLLLFALLRLKCFSVIYCYTCIKHPRRENFCLLDVPRYLLF